jgi:hypothetical protein
MGKRIKIAAAVIGALIAIVGVAVWAGRLVSDRRIDAEVDELLAAIPANPPAVVSEEDLAGLPEPVQRWLRWSQIVGKEYPQTVRLEQEGDFRLGEERGWMSYDAVQYYTTEPPGYVWSVSMRMAPLVTITGRDQYMDGEGSIRMSILSLIPVANDSGGGLNQGSLLRYLNETMWFPAAVISPYITWDPVDDHSATATMSFGGVTASATFIFDDDGRLTNMTADRYNDDRDDILPWSTPILAYGEFEGVRVPTEGTGVWHYDTGDFTYIRLTITDIDYNPER